MQGKLMNQASRKDQIATLLMAMTHRELDIFAGELSKMLDAIVRPKAETKAEFIELLFDWAEAICTDLKMGKG